MAQEFYFISIPKCASKTIKSFTQFGGRYHHMPASQLRKIVPNFDTAFTFACVRHPIDLVVSWYNYHKYSDHIKDFVKKQYPDDINVWINKMNFKTHWSSNYHPMKQHLFVCHGDKLLVKKILHFENLSKDIEEVRKILNIPKDRDFPITNASKHIVTREDLTIASIEKIKKFFKKDFELFGYSDYVRVSMNVDKSKDPKICLELHY